MFLKFSFNNSPTLALAAYAFFTSCNFSFAQTSVSYGQIRNLPAVDAQPPQEAGNVSRLIAINDEKSLSLVSQLSKARIVRVENIAPPVPPAAVQSQASAAPPAPSVERYGSARIVSSKDLVPPASQSQSNTEPPTPETEFAPPIARVTMLPSNVTADTSPVIDSSKVGHYTVSFGNSYDHPQSDEDVTELPLDKDLDSPTLGQFEADDPNKNGADDDLEESDVDELDLSADELEDEIEDDFDEDDSPIARPEFGQWPSRSIRETRLDLAEYGAEAPEDRSSKLFESSQRFDDSIAATEKVFAWAAPNISYQPLYFEDVALERYGQTKGLVKQPFVSAGRFLADNFLLTTRALRVCPHSCDSPLGFCRPGSPSTAANGSAGCGCSCFSRSQEDCKSCR